MWGRDKAVKAQIHFSLHTLDQWKETKLVIEYRWYSKLELKLVDIDLVQGKKRQDQQDTESMGQFDQWE